MKRAFSITSLWCMLALSIAFYCYEFFLRISPSVMVGPLMHYFELDAFGISKLLAVFYIAYTLGQIPAGLLLDRYSIRLVLAIAAFVCVIGLHFFIDSPNITLAWIGRFIIGFSASFAFVAVLKIGRTYLPPYYFTRIVAITVAVGTLLAAYGDVVATHLAGTHFKFIFYVSMMLGLGLCALFSFFYLFFYEPKEDKEASHTFTWQDLIKLLKIYPLWLNGLVGGLFYLPTTVLADVWGDYFLRSEYYFSLTQSSYSIIWLFIGWMVGSPIMGYLSDRFEQQRNLISINALLSIIILIHMILLPDSLKILSLLMFLLGVTSSAQLIVWRIYHQLAPLKLAATGIALTNMVIMFTCALGQMLIGFLLSDHQTSHNINLYTNADYRHSLMILPVALIAAALLVRLLPKVTQTRR
jgi:MFS family permease